MAKAENDGLRQVPNPGKKNARPGANGSQVSCSSLEVGKGTSEGGPEFLAEAGHLMKGSLKGGAGACQRKDPPPGWEAGLGKRE